MPSDAAIADGWSRFSRRAPALAEGVTEGGHEGPRTWTIPGRVADRHCLSAGTDVWLYRGCDYMSEWGDDRVVQPGAEPVRCCYWYSS